MEGSSNKHFQNQHKGLGFGTINFSDYQGLEVSGSKSADVLSQEVQNLVVKDPIGNENAEGGPMGSKDGQHWKQNYPVRPEVDNCFYFMHHGWCKYGFNCRYNHPYNQANKEIMKPGEENLNKMEQVECKHPEGCRNEIVVAPIMEFSFPGLPIPSEANECPYYRYNGSCKYGINCWFDHPEPSSMEGGFPLSGYTGLEDTMPSWSLEGPVNQIGLFDPYMYQAAPTPPYSEWSDNQVPIGPNKEWSQSMPATFSMKAVAASAKPFQPNQAGVLIQGPPKQEVNPESSKFGFGFHYPKTSWCPLNDRGLPIRSDMEVCPLYGRHGVCKDGPACRFNHPAIVPKVVSHDGSEEALVSAAESQEAQVPPGSQEAHPPQLPDLTRTEDKN